MFPAEAEGLEDALTALATRGEGAGGIMQAGPHDADGARGGKAANAGEFKIEGRRFAGDLGERGADLANEVVGHFAEELEREVHLLGRQPSNAWIVDIEPALNPNEGLVNGQVELNRCEEAHGP